MNKKIFIYTGIGFFIFAGISATHPPDEKPHWKNLKVIPKNTDAEQMERIMYKYTRQLSVTCGYCHPYTKPDVFPKDVDFASEEKPQKLVARDMMRMTDKINKKYFDYLNDYSMESFQKAAITCNTCHRGVLKPVNMKMF